MTKNIHARKKRARGTASLLRNRVILLLRDSCAQKEQFLRNFRFYEINISNSWFEIQQKRISAVWGRWKKALVNVFGIKQRLTVFKDIFFRDGCMIPSAFFSLLFHASCSSSVDFVPLLVTGIFIFFQGASLTLVEDTAGNKWSLSLQRSQTRRK